MPAVPAKLANQGAREDWLNAFVEGARPIFKNAGHPLPEIIKISIGFPSRAALSRNNRRIGECWENKDGSFHVFVSPMLDSDVAYASVSTHELCHAAVGIKNKHNKTFVACGKSVGLEGKPSHMVGGEDWHDLFVDLLTSLGPLPHIAIDPVDESEKKQTTRMLKCECSKCGFVFRTTAKWLEDKTILRCPDTVCEGVIEL